jgi:putative endonuclease
MYYVYALISNVDNQFYVGFTNDLKMRMDAHAKGKVESTRNRRPLKLVY